MNGMRGHLEDQIPRETVRREVGAAARKVLKYDACGFSGVSRTRDGRYSFTRPSLSLCEFCAPPLGKPHNDAQARDHDWEGPCNSFNRQFCDRLAWSMALQALGTPEQAEIALEAELWRRGFTTAEVRFGRGSAYNLSLSVRISQEEVLKFRKAARAVDEENRAEYFRQIRERCDRHVAIGSVVLSRDPESSRWHCSDGRAALVFKRGDDHGNRIDLKAFDPSIFQNVQVIVSASNFDIICGAFEEELPEIDAAHLSPPATLARAASADKAQPSAPPAIPAVHKDR